MISYQSLLLSTTVLNDYMLTDGGKLHISFNLICKYFKQHVIIIVKPVHISLKRALSPMASIPNSFN